MNKPENVKKKKTPWPTKAVMEQIYDLKLWGGKDIDFYSGEGSHDPAFVDPYLDVITSFFQSKNSALIVCDLGCGDFNIGKRLVSHTKQYIGIDIVQSLIDRNKKIHNQKNLEFHCLDIATDPIPSGNCVLLRQVLQHITNSEIQQILEKITDFQYAIITEHLPTGDFEPNKDIISGQGIRLKKQSGVDILSSPFQFKVKEKKQLLSIPLPDHKSNIVTTLYTIN